MASPLESVIDELNSLTECCVCFGKFKDPRTLPCIHTFCLQCLQHLVRYNLPGDRVRCPLCNQKFRIPLEGIGGLPGNPFVSRILELGRSAITQGSARQQDEESSERRKLKRNAEIVSRLLQDGIRCTQVRQKAVTNVIGKHETVKNAIIKRIEDLNSLLDDLQAQRQRKMEALEDVQDEMDGHLATLASYKNYCLDLAERGTASDVTKELVVLDSTLKELEEVHESRIGREFAIQQQLLDQVVLDSVLTSSLLNTTAGNVQEENLLRSGLSSESPNGGTEEPNRKRMRIDGSETGGQQEFPFDSQLMDNFDSLIQNQVFGVNSNNTNASSSATPLGAAHSGISPSSGTSPSSSTFPSSGTSPSSSTFPSSDTFPSSSTTMDSSTAPDSNILPQPSTSSDSSPNSDPGTNSTTGTDQPFIFYF